MAWRGSGVRFPSAPQIDASAFCRAHDAVTECRRGRCSVTAWAIPFRSGHAPGGPKPAAALSMTNTQSAPDGEVKERVPVVAASARSMDEPFDGSYHCACACEPLMDFMLTTIVRDVGT